MKIKCLIVDDEPPAIALMEKYLSMVDNLELVQSCQSAVKAFDLLKTNSIDLMFLDIQMPVLNGIDLIKTLKDPPAVILTTAYREYAIEGYDLDIVDYLLKPITFERFLKAVERYAILNKTTHISQSEVIITEASKQHIYFKVGGTNHKIILSDIIYLESLKDYVKIHMCDKHLVVKGNIGSVLKKLPEDQFIRIHRSFAVSQPAINSYSSNQVVVASTELPIGISYKQVFLKSMSGA